MFKAILFGTLILFSRSVWAAPAMSDSSQVENLPGLLNHSIFRDSRQVLAVYNQDPGTYRAVLVAYEKNADDWIPVFSAIPVTIGRNGFAALDEKIEGDGKTPTGVFPLGIAFGYDASSSTRLDYRQCTHEDYWVDDGGSPQYNTWVSGTPIAKSFERMLRDDHLYKYGIVIEYNINPVIAGKGSAIFIHLWRDPFSATDGCVAMSEADLLKLLKWLDKSKKPQIVLGNHNGIRVNRG